MGTLVERKTRYVALVHLKDGTATTTTKGFGTILQHFAANWRKSLTYDQGKEMSGHEQLGVWAAETFQCASESRLT